MPRFVERELRAFLKCGILAHGFARVQLLRYCARPPLSHDRLAAHSDGRLRLALKTPWHDGTTHLLLSADELIERLVALIPRPEKNLIVYHGVLAPNAKWRARVTSYQREQIDTSPQSCAALSTDITDTSVRR
jgi:hypothetical protein